MRLRVLALLLLASSLAWGQGGVSSGSPITFDQNGHLVLQNVLVAVCANYPGATPSPPCAEGGNSLVTLYTNVALTAACTGAAGNPLNNLTTPSAGNGCSNPGTPLNGNVIAYASPGTYWCEYYGSGISTTVVSCPFPSSQQIVIASQFTGADCGAKIANAQTALGASTGEVWVNQSCGTAWTSAISINAGNVLRIVQPGTYTLSAGITLLGSSLLAGSTGAMNPNSTPTVMLKMANSVNLPSMVTVNGPNAAIQDISLEGNKANNPSGSTGISVTSLGNRLEISRATVGNFSANGVLFTNIGTSKIFKLLSYQNTGDGIFFNVGGDNYITDSEFENNLQSGLEINNSPANRIIHSDFGQNSINAGCGIFIYGSGAATSNYNIITGGNEFGNQYRNDICITGYVGGNVTVGNQITGNTFIGSQFLILGNTYSQIAIQDGGLNLVTGNVFGASGTSGCSTICDYFAAISIAETNAGRSLGNRVTGNAFIDTNTNGGSPAYHSGRVVDSTVTNGNTCSNIAANTMALSAGWGTGATIGSGSGYVPDCAFIITSGSAAFSASPTVTWTYPVSLAAGVEMTPACQLTVVGITGAGGAILFNPTAISITATTWTAQTSTGAAFTPAATETYKVITTCVP